MNNNKIIGASILAGCALLAGAYGLMQVSYNQGYTQGMDKAFTEFETFTPGNTTEFCVIDDEYYFIGAEVVNVEDDITTFENVFGGMYEYEGEFEIDNLYLLTMKTPMETPDYYEDDEILVVWELTE